MTTLPQTSPGAGRLPKSRSNGHPSLPSLPSPNGAPGPRPGPSAGAAPAMTAGDVIRILRSNLWLLLAALVVSTAAGYGLNRYLAANYPEYTAVGRVQIEQRDNIDPLGVLNGLRTADSPLSIEQQTQSQLLRSDSLWANVLQTPGLQLRDTAWFKSFERVSPTSGKLQPDVAAAKASIAENFGVAPIPESKLITVSMTTADPESAAVVLRDIVQTHIDLQQQGRQNQTTGTTGLLESNLNALQRDVEALSREVKGAQTRLGTGDDLTVGIGTKSIKERLMADLINKRGDAEVEAEAAARSYENLREQMQKGISPLSAEAAAEANPRVQGYQQQLDALDIDIETQSNKYGPTNPYVVLLRERRDVIQAKYDQQYSEARINATDRLFDAADGEMKAAQSRLDKLNEQIAATSGELETLTIDVADLLYKQETLATKRANIVRLTDQISAINNQNTRRDLGGVQWANQPLTPDARSFPKLRNTMGGAIVVGLALALGIAFLREVLDTSVRSPRDIARVGQMTLLGMIPHEDDDPQSAGANLAKVIANAPQSILAEQFRQVRTRLQQAANLDTVRTILVTSPGPGDGKTVVACNLAAGLALNGRKILLVDANFRRPSIHEAMGVGNDAGLSDVLRSPGAFESAVVPVEGLPNLDVLPVGPRAANPTELLESAALHEFIDRALEEYDHVVFDSGPMLVVSETVALAPRVDGVITVVRAKANSRGVLGRLRDSLRQVRAEHLGVVLNAVRSQAGGYYNRNIKTYYAYQNGR